MEKYNADNEINGSKVFTLELFYFYCQSAVCVSVDISAVNTSYR